MMAKVMGAVVALATAAWVVFGQQTLHPNLSIVLGTTVLFVSGLGLSLMKGFKP